MGKWSWLKGQFPKLAEDPSYEDVKRVYEDRAREWDMPGVLAAYNDARERKAELEKQEGDVNAEIEALERVIETRFESLGTESVSTETYRFTISPTPYAQVKDKALLRQWVMEQQPESLSLPWPTLNSIVKAALETGEQLPPGVEVYIKSSVSRTKRWTKR